MTIEAIEGPRHVEPSIPSTNNLDAGKRTYGYNGVLSKRLCGMSMNPVHTMWASHHQDLHQVAR